NSGVNKIDINWYPGHMQKTKRLISEKLSFIDIVYEVIDARMPYSSKIKDIDKYIKNKPCILIMTKIDLCDIVETDKWIKYYEKKGYIVVKVDLEENKNVKQIIEKTNTMMNDFNQMRIQKGMKTRKIRVLIVGIPNVGKSTLINSLVGKKATTVGNKPGVTKSLDWIRINKDIELLDTPGILWPKFDTDTIAFNLASLTAIKEEVLPLDQVAIYILKQLNQYYPHILEQRYNIKEIDFNNIEKTLDIIGKKRGCLIKGGLINYDKVFDIIINDVKNGNICGITFDRIQP
ncbi:MAG: ribosome biogenesis GTPase YlqF, partial [Bacilli bacterium]